MEAIIQNVMAENQFLHQVGEDDIYFNSPYPNLAFILDEDKGYWRRTNHWSMSSFMVRIEINEESRGRLIMITNRSEKYFG